MIVLQSAGLILFAGLLRFMYLYLQKHLARVGENHMWYICILLLSN